MSSKRLLLPDRLRVIEKPFAAIPCRLLQGGFLGRLSPEAAQLYLLLYLAADRRGLSYWGVDRIAAELRLPPHAITTALAQLQDVDLLATDGTSHQVLSLPPPLRPTPPSPSPNPTSPTEESREIPADIRRRIDNLFGTR